jgi:hypothetical protein
MRVRRTGRHYALQDASGLLSIGRDMDFVGLHPVMHPKGVQEVRTISRRN